MDEVDVFFYVDNFMFYYVVKNSVKENGLRIFLIVIFIDELDRKVCIGELK